LLISGQKKEIKIKKNNNITFGILFFFFFLIIGLYPLKSDEAIRVWSVVLSLVLLIITIIKPNLFTHLNRLWIKFGILLGIDAGAELRCRGSVGFYRSPSLPLWLA